MVGAGISPLEEAKEKLALQQQNRCDNGVQQWAVELIEQERVIGACGLSRLGTSTTLQLAFCHVPESQGFGYATEAGILVCRYGLTKLNQPFIAAGTLGDHEASQNVLHKIGFRRKGTIVGTIVWPDNNQEDPYFELVLKDLVLLHASTDVSKRGRNPDRRDI